jgi:membrane-bound serine protease (ClpP class)
MFRLLPLLLALYVAPASADRNADTATGQVGPLVLQARLDDQPITPGVARYLERAIREADQRRAECLVIVMDTPGGLLDSTRSIVKEMLASRTCVVVYVSPAGARAASAGVFITLASHVAAMTPGTTIGAAHPVEVGGLPFQAPRPGPPNEGTGQPSSAKKPSASRAPMEEKIVNDTVAWARALADQRHRNADWAARAVSESVSVTADEAVRLGVVDFEAADFDDLLAKLDGRQAAVAEGTHTLRTRHAEVEVVGMWWGEEVLDLLSRPNVAFLLIVFGFYGILFELSHPSWVAGTLGVICLLLGFFGLSVLPVNYLGLALVLVALVLFTAEVFVTSFGVLTLVGVVCLVLGGVMLVNSPGGFFRVSLGIVVPLASATAAITLLLVSRVVRVHRRRAQTGDEGLLGVRARARAPFSCQAGRYVGTVFVHGEWWQAESDAPVALGQECTVEGRRDLTLIVRPADAPDRGA